MAGKNSVVLRTFQDELSAEMARNILEAEGVFAVLRKDDCGGMYPQFQGLRGVRLFVSIEDAERAEEILNGYETTPDAASEPE